ncbi:MAG: hypothetical protein D6762_02055 [Candidatus Neomarinimicrobiota bacterium]|nr:MAG: hypothetical protein D6762_02055 [Candidatus Neomarinimicrobiota bacterium]
MNANTGAFSGTVYYHYRVNPDESITNSFEYSRIYFGYKRQVSDRLRYTFKTDIDPSVSPRTLYIKLAQMDWDTPLGQVVIGLQGMNLFPIQEKTWGYRAVEKSAMDRFQFSSSADLGLGFYPALGLSRLHTSILITNGSGYKKPEGDAYKKLSVQAFWGEPRLDKGAGWNAGIVASTERQDVGVDTTDQVSVLGVFSGWSSGKLRLGADLNARTHSQTWLETESLVSLYGTLGLSNLRLLGRVDLHRQGSASSRYETLGVVFTPEKGLDIIPVVRREVPAKGDALTTGGVTFQFKI